MKKPFKGLTACTATTALCATVALVACGSHGDSEASADANSGLPASMQGTYVVACTGDTRQASSGESNQGTITIIAPAGDSAVHFGVHKQVYVGSTDCSASTLSSDFTATGRLSPKGTTRTYADASGSVTVGVATFVVSGAIFSKGNSSRSLPTPGQTTDLDYVLDGNKLYVSNGDRSADSLMLSLSPRAGVRQ
jgi:hypothetical protein